MDRQAERAMVRHAVFPFKMDWTDETLTSREGMVLFAGAYADGPVLRALVDRHLVRQGNNRGLPPSVFPGSLLMHAARRSETTEFLRSFRTKRP